MITRAYRIITVSGQKALLCLICDGLSYNPNDIAHNYCGHCHVFLDRLPESYRRLSPSSGRLSPSSGLDEPVP